MNDSNELEKNQNPSSDAVNEDRGDMESGKVAPTSSVSQGDHPSGDNKGTQADAKPKRHRRRIIVIIIIVVVVLILAAIAFMVYRGVLAPAGQAAKYDVLSYVSEQDVTDYIENYREQMGVSEEDGDEATWATFLSQYNLTPEILRTATITQLIDNQITYQKCDQLGITASDEEIDAVVDATKESYAFGDEDTWNQTLEMYGQTEEGYREVVELELLQRHLFSEEVEMPTPTDEEVSSYIVSTVPTLDSNKTKHTYFFELSQGEDESSYDNLKAVEEIRNAFADGDEKTPELFSYLVTTLSDNEDLIETGGANGWDIDTASYTTEYLQRIENLSKGEVSVVFATDTGHGFAWVDDVYKFPKNSKKLAALTADDMPETLWSYLSDCEAYVLWQTDCDVYLNDLYEEANVIIFPMPADVPYNVDMSLAIETTEADSDEESADVEADSDDSATATEPSEDSDEDAAGDDEARQDGNTNDSEEGAG